MAARAAHRTRKKIEQYERYLKDQEKAPSTISKYTCDIRKFYTWLGKTKLSREAIIKYKEYLSKHFKLTSANSKLISLNKYFEFCGKHELKVKTFKIQKKAFIDKEKELTKAEYARLVEAAGKNNRLQLVIETICATGIRVSELSYITAEAVASGRAEVLCKGKSRIVMLPEKLIKHLKVYICEQNITSGYVFVTRSGRPLDRSNIWAEMKALCKKAKVNKNKVFPHNLRHLFARTFYEIEKDIARLADILGHSSIETTRIYIISSGNEHIRQLEKMKLVM